MKKDKILSCIIGVCVALFCGTIGYLFGAQGFNINQKARALKSPVTITKEIKEKGFNTKKIALVNADEAVAQGGKTINYADKLISGMPKNFESVSLEMAKEGVKNGNYGAYIIIPSTFSQSVVSINSTPKPVDLQYKISSKITKTSQVEVVYDVINFEKKLNAGMSYMYISSILNEFHNTQDGASVVMGNDQKDKQALLAITPTDLTTLVQTPDLPESAMNPMPQIDTKSCDTAIDDINTNYTYYISLGQKDLDKLKESGNELVNKWTGEPKENPIPASSNVAPNPFLPPVPENQNNKPVNYDAQLETVLKQVDEYNANLEKFEKSYYSNLIKANANISACNNQYADIVSNYNGHLEDVRKHTSDVVFETLSKEGGKVTISYKDGNLLVDDAKTNAYDSSLTNDVNSYSKDLEKMITESGDKELIEKYNSYKSNPQNASKVAAVDQLRNNPDVAVLNKVSVTEQVNTNVNKVLLNKSASKDAVIKAVSDALPQNFDDSIDVNGAKTTVRDCLKSTDELLTKQTKNQSTGNQDSVIERFDREGLKNNIKNNLLNTVISDSSKTQIGMNEGLRSFVADVNKFNLGSYIDTEKLGTSFDLARSKNQEIQKTYEENFLANQKYISDLTMDSQNNIFKMQESIQQANDTSNANVESLLNGAIGVKDTSIKENSDILMGITQKLPYTRLGELEATNTYKFITSPAKLRKDKKSLSKGSGIISNITRDTVNDKNSYINMKNILYIILVLLCIGFVTYVVKIAMHKEQEEEIF